MPCSVSNCFQEDIWGVVVVHAPSPVRKNMVVLGALQGDHMLCWKWRRQRANITDAVVVLHLVPRGADTAEGALQVLAGARGAGPRQAHTLVDVCRGGEITNESFCAQLRGLGCRVPYYTQTLPAAAPCFTQKMQGEQIRHLPGCSTPWGHGLSPARPGAAGS